MRILIAEDDFISSRYLHKILYKYGECDLAEDGAEASRFFEDALASGQPYDLVCLDIMMPKMNGQEVLKTIRRLEREQKMPEENRARVIMATALDSPQSVIDAYSQGGSDGYLVKPIKKQLLLEKLQQFGMVD